MLTKILTVPGILTPKECEMICNYCSPKCVTSTVAGKPASDGSVEPLENLKVRNSKNCFISPNQFNQKSPKEVKVRSLFGKVVNAFGNAAAYGFDFPISNTEDLQYAEYSEGMYYDYHIDAGDTDAYDRDMSASFILSSSKDYTGGELSFMMQHKGSVIIDGKTYISFPKTHTPKCNQGDLVVFPSMVIHSVGKVLSGKRSSLVIWGRRPRIDLTKTR